MKNTGLIFRFTLSRVVKNRTWKITTGVIALILLVVPMLILTLLLSEPTADELPAAAVNMENSEQSADAAGNTGMDTSADIDTDTGTDINTNTDADTDPGADTGTVDAEESEEAAAGTDSDILPDAIYAADISAGAAYDFTEIGSRLDRQIISYSSAEEAIDAAKDTHAPVLLLMDYEGSYAFQILIDSEADHSETMENILTEALDDAGEAMLLDKAGITREEHQEWESQQDMEWEHEEDPLSIIRMILVFLNVMVLYFLVLFYGKNTAESIVLEKSSKLMETLLTSVRPPELLYGKVFGVTAASILQLCIWLVCGGVSAAAGLKLSGGLPTEVLAVLQMVKLIFVSMPGSGIYSLILAVLFIFAGFFLYSCLAALGGAAAGKQEDLASANTLFTLVLVASFLLVLRWGVTPDNAVIGTILCWVPFTSIMLAPASLIIGEMSVISGMASLCLTVAVSLLIIYLASKIYQAFILYRGKMPNPQAIIRALRKE